MATRQDGVRRLLAGVEQACGRPVAPAEVMLALARTSADESVGRRTREIDERLARLRGEVESGEMVLQTTAKKEIATLISKYGEAEVLTACLNSLGVR